MLHNHLLNVNQCCSCLNEIVSISKVIAKGRASLLLKLCRCRNSLNLCGLSIPVAHSAAWWPAKALCYVAGLPPNIFGCFISVHAEIICKYLLTNYMWHVAFEELFATNLLMSYSVSLRFYCQDPCFLTLSTSLLEGQLSHLMLRFGAAGPLQGCCLANACSCSINSTWKCSFTCANEAHSFF